MKNIIQPKANDIKLSIIIPIYNVEKYLRKCLDSIISQEMSGVEIICVNDCSPDNSAVIIEEYKRKFSTIRVINNEKNIGLSCSRNVGLAAASGKYVWFVDSDDYIVAGAANKLYQKAEVDNLDIIYFNKKTVYDKDWNGDKGIRRNRIIGEDDIISGQEMFINFYRHKSLKSMNAYTQFFKTSFLRDNGLRFYPGLLHEDFLFYFQCAMKASRTGNMDQSLYVYRQRKGSITDSMTTARRQSMYIVLNEVLSYWKSNETNKELNEAISKYCELLRNTCNDYNKDIGSFSQLQLGTEADKFMYEMLYKPLYIDIDDKKLLKIKKAKKIWVYGAGNVGKEVADYLNRIKIDIYGYLVSGSSNSKFFGYSVTGIDETEIASRDLIIVAATYERRREMIKKLHSINHSNYICATSK